MLPYPRKPAGTLRGSAALENDGLWPLTADLVLALGESTDGRRTHIDWTLLTGPKCILGNLIELRGFIG
jgi:hypothetical protein